MENVTEGRERFSVRLVHATLPGSARPDVCKGVHDDELGILVVVEKRPHIGDGVLPVLAWSVIRKLAIVFEPTQVLKRLGLSFSLEESLKSPLCAPYSSIKVNVEDPAG